MLFEKRRDRAARLVVLLHAQRQRLGAAHHQPGIERRKNCAGAVLNKPDPGRVVFVVQYHRAADAVGMSIQILGGRVDHDVDAKLERPLQVRRHESVVANDARAGAMRNLGDFASDR